MPEYKSGLIHCRNKTKGKISKPERPPKLGSSWSDSAPAGHAALSRNDERKNIIAARRFNLLSNNRRIARGVRVVKENDPNFIKKGK